MWAEWGGFHWRWWRPAECRQHGRAAATSWLWWLKEQKSRQTPEENTALENELKCKTLQRELWQSGKKESGWKPEVHAWPWFKPGVDNHGGVKKHTHTQTKGRGENTTRAMTPRPGNPLLWSVWCLRTVLPSCNLKRCIIQLSTTQWINLFLSGSLGPVINIIWINSRSCLRWSGHFDGSRSNPSPVWRKMTNQYSLSLLGLCGDPLPE